MASQSWFLSPSLACRRDEVYPERTKKRHPISARSCPNKVRIHSYSVRPILSWLKKGISYILPCDQNYKIHKTEGSSTCPIKHSILINYLFDSKQSFYNALKVVKIIISLPNPNVYIKYRERLQWLIKRPCYCFPLSSSLQRLANVSS